MTEPNIYTLGGTVQANEQGVYISRQADAELQQLCRESKFAYVLTPRQLGKSSLMIRTAEQLIDEGIQPVIIDLTQIGTQVTADEWYSDFLDLVASQLMLSTDVKQWWQAHSQSGKTLRLTRFFQEVVLAEVAAPIVIFVDEIDTTLSLDFTDDFYAAIRYLYVARSTDPVFHRLSFVLIGVATPADLIRDPKRTPFNIGDRVDLSDFTELEAVPLSTGLGLPAETAQSVLRWVLAWTGGHPYLTQRLCRALADEQPGQWSEAVVEQAVVRTFFGPMSEQDNNLQFVRDMLTKRAPSPIEREVLETYRQIHRGKIPVLDEEQSLVKSHLKLSGIVHRKGKHLQVRNPIYYEVFDRQWIREHLPETMWQRLKPAMPLIASLLAFSALTSGLAVFAYRQQLSAEIQKRYAEEQRLNAEKQRLNAEEQTQIANNAREAANRERDRANEKEEEALEALREAEKQTANALSQRKRAEEQAQIAKTEKQRAEDQATIAQEQTLIAQEQTTIAQEQTTIAETEAKNAIAEKNRADEQTQIAKQQTTVAQLQEQAARVLSLLSTENRAEGLLLAIDTMTQSQSLAGLQGSELTELQLTAQSSLLSAVQTAQEVNRLQGHERAVTSVAFSWNGRYIASGSSDKTVRLWDAQTGQPIGEPLRGHEGAVTSVAFSPNSDRIVSGSGNGTLQLWDVQTGQPIGEPLQGHEGGVTSVAFSWNGRYIASTSTDKTVRLWDAQTGQPIGEPLQGHESAVTSVAFSPNSDRIVSGSDRGNGTVRLWDIQTGLPIGEPLQGHEGGVTSVAFSWNGRYIASGSSDKAVRVWDVQTRQPIGEPLRGHEDRVTSVAFSPDSRRIVTGSGGGQFTYDSSIRIWDVETGKPIGQPWRSHGSEVKSVAHSPSGNLIASGGQDGAIRLWDTQINQPIPQSLQGHNHQVNRVAVSSDSQLIAGTSKLNSNVLLWDVKTGRSISQVSVDRRVGQPKLLQFSADGYKIFIAGGRTIWSSSLWLQVWDIQNDQSTLHSIGNEEDIEILSLDGQHIATNRYDGSAQIWDIQTRQPVGHPLQSDSRGWLASLAFSPDGKHIAGGYQYGSVQLWDIQTGQPVGHPLQSNRGWVSSLAFSPDGKRIAVGHFRDAVQLWDVQTRQPIGRPLQTHASFIWSVAFSPDGERIVTSGDGQTKVMLWNAQTGQPIGQPLKGHKTKVFSVAFSSDDQYIVSGSDDRTVKVWDVSPDSWLTIGCERLKYHPLLKQPETVLYDQDMIQVAQRVATVCQEREWHQDAISLNNSAHLQNPLLVSFRQIWDNFVESLKNDRVNG